MGDRADLEIVIEAQADRVLAGLASFESALGKLEGAHGKAEVAAKHHSAELTSLEHQLEKLGERTEFVAMGFEHFRAIMGAGFGGAGIFGLEQLITGAATYDKTVSQLTNTLQGNAEAGSTWAVIAEHTGVQADILQRGFAKLGGEINGNSPVLRAMGIATVTTTGDLRDMNSVLLDAADYFHAHAGEVNNSHLAQELFGKSGVEMLPALQMGREGIAQITEEARKYGLILNQEALQRSRQFSAELQQGELAVKGLAVSIGNALLPGMAYLAQGLAQIVEKNLPAFIAGIERAVSFVIGFMEGLTGTNAVVDDSAVKMATLGNSVGGAGQALDTGAGAAQSNAEALRAVRDAARDATSAIDDQVRALDDQQRALQRSIDEQIKTLQGQGSQDNFDARQTRLKKEEASKQNDIERLKSDYVLETYLGNFTQAQSILQQITRATQEEANYQAESEKNLVDFKRQKQIDALKATLDSNKQETDDKKRALEDQKRAINDAAQSQIEAMQNAASRTNAALIGGFSGVADAGGAAGTAAGIRFAKDLNAEGIGKKAGEDIRRTIESGDWGAVGTKVGDALGEALATTVGRIVVKKLSDTKVGPFSLAQILSATKAYDTYAPITPGNIKNDIGAALGLAPFGQSAGDIISRAWDGLTFDRGGMVPGPPGAAQVAVVHGGERVQTREQQQAGNADVVAAIQELTRAVYETAPAAASLADFAVASSAASVQRMRGVMGTSFP